MLLGSIVSLIGCMGGTLIGVGIARHINEFAILGTIIVFPLILPCGLLLGLVTYNTLRELIYKVVRL